MHDIVTSLKKTTTKAREYHLPLWAPHERWAPQHSEGRVASHASWQVDEFGSVPSIYKGRCWAWPHDIPLPDIRAALPKTHSGRSLLERVWASMTVGPVWDSCTSWSGCSMLVLGFFRRYREPFTGDRELWFEQNPWSCTSWRLSYKKERHTWRGWKGKI